MAALATPRKSCHSCHRLIAKANGRLQKPSCSLGKRWFLREQVSSSQPVAAFGRLEKSCHRAATEAASRKDRFSRAWSCRILHRTGSNVLRERGCGHKRRCGDLQPAFPASASSVSDRHGCFRRGASIQVKVCGEDSRHIYTSFTIFLFVYT